uniref:ILEI/PANDER domain-containing protein n=1 Tax=Biomphalaria glabrata TaxID=6526 RepID=A0A2C9KKR8_BIOGL
MALSMCRPLRRIITKNFGSCKRFFLVLASLGIIVYTVRLLFVTDGRQVWDAKSETTNVSTPCDVECLPEQYSFYIKTGEKSITTGQGPIICFQGRMYMSPGQNNVNRGLNVVLIDSKSQDVKSINVFDTYIDESSLLRFLKKDAKADDIILLATFDDASTGLKESGRNWLSLFGSSLVTHLGFRENFIMIGHKGLAKGSAIEYYMAKQNKREDTFAIPIEKAGCFSFPMGKLVSMENTVPEVLRGKDMKIGKYFANCGMSEPCPMDTVSVSVFTGEGNVRKPSICVNSHYMMDGDVNDAGRGFNIVILDGETLQPSRLSHMDTYTFDSTDLELLLETLNKNEIFIAVIADDASNKLGQGARDLLNKIGSGHIQNLRFRDVWYFVGQKGIEGFSKHEQLSFAAFDGGWPKPLSSKFCLPKKVPSSQVMIDPEFNRNDARREFCSKYEGYMDFCDPAHVDDYLIAIPVAEKELKGHKIFDVPLIIVPGLNHNAFAHTLQTTLMQPGIKVDNVAVLWDEKIPEYAELTHLFGFRNFSMDSSLTYSEQLMKALRNSKRLFPNAEHIMVIEEDLLLAPDLIPFMAQSLQIVSDDPSLAGAFAWNINGFESSSGNSSLVYRVQEFPGLGFLMKTLVIQHLVDNWEDCCQNRAWVGWQSGTKPLEMLMPDMSRVYKTPFYGTEGHSDLARNLFIKPRNTFLTRQSPGLNLTYLIAGQYEDFLKSQLSISQVIPANILIPCLLQKSPPPDLSPYPSGPLMVTYEQSSPEDYTLLVKLCDCFGLVTLDRKHPKNLHKGLLRFYSQGHDIFLVGNKTVYMNSQVPGRYIITQNLTAAAN